MSNKIFVVLIIIIVSFPPKVSTSQDPGQKQQQNVSLLIDGSVENNKTLDDVTGIINLVNDFIRASIKEVHQVPMKALEEVPFLNDSIVQSNSTENDTLNMAELDDSLIWSVEKQRCCNTQELVQKDRLEEPSFLDHDHVEDRNDTNAKNGWKMLLEKREKLMNHELEGTYSLDEDHMKTGNTGDDNLYMEDLEDDLDRPSEAQLDFKMPKLTYNDRQREPLRLDDEYEKDNDSEDGTMDKSEKKQLKKKSNHGENSFLDEDKVEHMKNGSIVDHNLDMEDDHDGPSEKQLDSKMDILSDNNRHSEVHFLDEEYVEDNASEDAVENESENNEVITKDQVGEVSFLEDGTTEADDMNERDYKDDVIESSEDGSMENYDTEEDEIDTGDLKDYNRKWYPNIHKLVTNDQHGEATLLKDINVERKTFLENFLPLKKNKFSKPLLDDAFTPKNPTEDDNSGVANLENFIRPLENLESDVSEEQTFIWGDDHVEDDHVEMDAGMDMEVLEDDTYRNSEVQLDSYMKKLPLIDLYAETSFLNDDILEDNCTEDDVWSMDMKILEDGGTSKGFSSKWSPNKNEFVNNSYFLNDDVVLKSLISNFLRLNKKEFGPILENVVKFGHPEETLSLDGCLMEDKASVATKDKDLVDSIGLREHHTTEDTDMMMEESVYANLELVKKELRCLLIKFLSPSDPFDIRLILEYTRALFQEYPSLFLSNQKDVYNEQFKDISDAYQKLDEILKIAVLDNKRSCENAAFETSLLTGKNCSQDSLVSTTDDTMIDSDSYKYEILENLLNWKAEAEMQNLKRFLRKNVNILFKGRGSSTVFSHEKIVY